MDYETSNRVCLEKETETLSKYEFSATTNMFLNSSHRQDRWGRIGA